ncbi:hypothetical protein BDD12DRAFT_775595 [Trichophaea hybrida]|nr:hypothetical protein BDD12DRAFT_775595 [Trichophaea hybrida]
MTSPAADPGYTEERHTPQRTRPRTESELNSDENDPRTPKKRVAIHANVPDPLTPIKPRDVDAALQSAVAAYASPEAAVLSLMSLFDFNIPDLQAAIRAQSLDVSFSRVKYQDIAHFYKLDPQGLMDDAPTFDLIRPRLPNRIFRRTIEDMNLMLQQYGPPHHHASEQARARFLAPLFNIIIGKFRELFKNTPESMLQGAITTQGRIEYQYCAFGSINVVFIEMKAAIRTRDDLMTSIAQVLAEGDACDYNNFKHGFHLPIFGILTDGDTFRYFRFHRPEPVRRTGISISVQRGVYHSRSISMQLKSLDSCESSHDFLTSLRPICEVIYGVLVSAYLASIEAFYQRSLRSARKEVGKRRSTDVWYNAKSIGTEALQEAVEAAEMALRDLGEANVMAENAWRRLDESVELARGNEKVGREWNLLSGLREEDFDFA